MRLPRRGETTPTRMSIYVKNLRNVIKDKENKTVRIFYTLCHMITSALKATPKLTASQGPTHLYLHTQYILGKLAQYTLTATVVVPHRDVNTGFLLVV